MSQTMIEIERVACAIAVATEGHNRHWHKYIVCAKAAIKAMREPSDKMICRLLDENDKRKTTISESWNIMIDAALEEDQQ